MEQYFQLKVAETYAGWIVLAVVIGLFLIITVISIIIGIAAVMKEDSKTKKNKKGDRHG